MLADDLHARLLQLLKVPFGKIYRYGSTIPTRFIRQRIRREKKYDVCLHYNSF